MVLTSYELSHCRFNHTDIVGHPAYPAYELSEYIHTYHLTFGKLPPQRLLRTPILQLLLRILTL